MHSWTLVILSCAGLGLAAALVLVFRSRDQRARDRQRVRLRLRFPTTLERKTVEAFLRVLGALPRARHLHAGESSAVLEVVARRNDIRHYLRVAEGQAQYVTSQLRALAPTIRVDPTTDEVPSVTSAVELRLTDPARALQMDDPTIAGASVLAATQPLFANEHVVVQWVVVPGVSSPVRSDGSGVIGSGGILKALTVGQGRPDPETVSAARNKASAPIFRAVGRVGVAAANAKRAGHLLWRITGTFHSFRAPGVTLRRRSIPSELVAARIRDARTPFIAYPSRLNTSELVGLIGWPIDGPQIAGLSLGGSRQLLPDAAIPTRPRVLAQATFPGTERPLALPDREAMHHLHVIGPTGAGKSTLLGTTVLQDIGEGRGVVVIDPKGDLVSDILDRIPPRHVGRVVLLDPTDDERPVGLNLMHGAYEAPEVVTDQVVAIFHQMYSAYWGPRTQDVLHASLLTLAGEPGLTLCELPTLLVNDSFRRRLVAKIDDAFALGGFWSWYERLKAGERAQALGPLMNKVRPLLLRRRVRNVIGQSEPTFTMDEILADPKVLLVSLAKGLLGPEAAALMGSLVVAQLWQAIQRRARMSPSERRPAFVFLDEFQTYLNLPTDVADVLAQARGFGVGMVLAHQHLGQLTPALRQAVMANARSRVVFQTSADDATILARQLGGGLAASDLQDLDAFHVYASMYAAGRVRAPASAATYPMPESRGIAAEVREASRRRYGRSRSEVEAGIRERQRLAVPDSPVGRIRRER